MIDVAQSQPQMANAAAFRPINEREKHQIGRQTGRTQVTDRNFESILILFSAAASGELTVSYQTMQGGFTVCTICLWDKDAYVLWVGASRRSRRDRINPIRGEAIAFNRAIRYGDPLVIQAPSDPLKEESREFRDIAAEIVMGMATIIDDGNEENK